MTISCADRAPPFFGDPVYQIENQRQALEGNRALGSAQAGRPKVSRNVLFLGFNSFLTDISSEMVSTILPLYLLFTLRLAPLQFGIIDGIYQGGSVLVRVASGFVADRWRDPKGVATVGYGLSAVCKLGFLLVRGPWLALTGLIMLDRIGKGIRTAPRDALISLSSPASGLGAAFGVHRAMDTAGAMLGPLLAFGLLAIAPDAFDAIFVVSFCFALLGVALLVLFVRNPPKAKEEGVPVARVSAMDAARLVNAPDFRVLLWVGSALSLATVSDSFLYLSLQDQLDLNIGFFPLLFVATALAYMLLAVPVGRIADRVGRGRVFIAGYAVLGLAYATLLLPNVVPLQLLAPLALLGAYYAMTDGVLPALASTMIPAELRASGLGLLATATGLSRLFASILFGIAWTLLGIQVALSIFLVGLLVAFAVAALAMRGGRMRVDHG
jgi:MFS family permease